MSRPDSSAVGMASSDTPGSPWMPRPTPILPSGTVNSGSSAPGRVQPSNATPRVRVAAFAVSGHPDHAREVEAVLGRGARTLEDREIACDAAPLGLFALRGAGDVVGDCEVVRVDALAAQLGDGKPEVHHVAGVVAGRQQHARRHRARPATTDAASSADGEVKMLPTTAPSANPGPTVPQNAG